MYSGMIPIFVVAVSLMPSAFAAIVAVPHSKPPSKTFVKSTGAPVKIVDRIQEKLEKPDAHMVAFAQKYSAKNVGLNSSLPLVRERVYEELSNKLKKLKTEKQDEAYFTFLANLHYAQRKSEETEASLSLERLVAEQNESIEKNLRDVACQILGKWRAEPALRDTTSKAQRMLDEIVQTPSLKDSWLAVFDPVERKQILDKAIRRLLSKQGFSNIKTFTLEPSPLKNILHIGSDDPLSYEVTFPGSSERTRIHFSLNDTKVTVETPNTEVTVAGLKNVSSGRLRFEQAPDFVTPVYGVSGTLYAYHYGSLEPSTLITLVEKGPQGEEQSTAYYRLEDALAGYLYETIPRSFLNLEPGRDTDAEAFNVIHGAIYDAPCFKEFYRSTVYRPAKWNERKASGH